MKIANLFISLILLGSPFQIAANSAEALIEPKDIANLLLDDPALHLLVLSQDGLKVAFVTTVDGKKLVAVKDFRLNKVTPVLVNPLEHSRFTYLEWLNEEKLLVSIENDHEYRLNGITYAGKNEVMTTSQQIFSVNIDGSELMELQSSFASGEKVNNSSVLSYWDFRFVNSLKSDPEHVLGINGKHFIYIVKKNINTGKVTKVGKVARVNRGWASTGVAFRHFKFDEYGQARLGYAYEGNMDRKLRLGVYDPQKNKWVKKYKFDIKPAQEGPRILNTHTADNGSAIAYVTDEHEGRRALFKWNIYSDYSTKELIYQSDHYDLMGSIYTSKKTNKPVGVQYIGKKVNASFWDSKYQSLYDWFNTQYAQYNNIIISSDQSERFFIFYSSSPTNPGNYYFVDSQDKRVTALGNRKPTVVNHLNFQHKPITFTARDGVQIEGMLLYPKQKPKGGYKMIIKPHGGPIVREYADFDTHEAFLASQGYSVFTLNFRGSGGYGQAHLKAGFKEWGGKIQNDIVDGVKHIIKSGYADKDAICIYGGSFGGYSALMGAISDEIDYRCAVSLAGISNLEKMRARERHRGALEYWVSALGSTKEDWDQMKQWSPINYIEKFNIPLLLVHGDLDHTVYPDQSTSLHDALIAAKKDSTLVIYDDEAHSLSKKKNHMDFLMRLYGFLQEHLPIKENTPKG